MRLLTSALGAILMMGSMTAAHAQTGSDVQRVVAQHVKTIIPGDSIEIDFTHCTLHWRGDHFGFPPLGSVPQSLVIAGGAENIVARKLGLKQEHPELVHPGD